MAFVPVMMASTGPGLMDQLLQGGIEAMQYNILDPFTWFMIWMWIVMVLSMLFKYLGMIPSVIASYVSYVPDILVSIC
jgi:hypothetical protein